MTTDEINAMSPSEILRRVTELDRLYLDWDQKARSLENCQGTAQEKKRLRRRANRAWNRYKRFRDTNK